MATFDNSTCCVCFNEISPKQRRVINSPAFQVLQQLQEVLQRILSDDDKYVCTFCFAKLNRLSKIDYDLKNKLDALKKEKDELLKKLREKLTISQKRHIIHSPTPRKLKKCQVLRTPSKLTPGLCRPLVPQDTPKTTKRRRLFFRDPPVDSVRVSEIYEIILRYYTICITCI